MPEQGACGGLRRAGAGWLAGRRIDTSWVSAIGGYTMGYSDENFLETLEKFQEIKYNKVVAIIV